MNHDILTFKKKISEYNASYDRKSIGTLGERCLHSIIKNYYESDFTKQEVKVCGYVADILNDDGIIEIQTNNFYSLARKLEEYLKFYKVCIVYPVPHVKHIIWVDPDTGEVVKRNKSPKHGTGSEFLYEASRLIKYLNNENLNFEILLIDMDEYRLLNGWNENKKRGSLRCDRKPLALHDVIRIESKYDLSKILPPDFPDGEFKFSDFEKVMKMKNRTARYSLNTLIEYGAVEIIKKEKRSNIYRKTI